MRGLQDIQAVLNSTIVYLRSLELRFSCDGFIIKKAMEAFSSGEITTLESFSYGWSFPPRNTFDSLVGKNKSLRDVQINIAGSANIEYEYHWVLVFLMVQCFFQASKLKSLEINHEFDGMFPEKKEPIADFIWYIYRFRRVRVSIDTFKYS